MQIEKIEDIKKRIKNEWLLIRVTEYDKTTSTSKKGRLIAHNPNRDTIYKKLISVKGKSPVLVDYSEHKPSKDIAVIFYIYA
jgi:hypothetical protein